MIRAQFLLGAAGAALVLASAAGAQAHTAYILPNAFDAQGRSVSLIGAMTEDDYFTPDGALRVPAYQETQPGGTQVEIKPAATLKDLTVTEAPLEAPGTYRFSTGQFATRTTTYVNVGGRWLFIRLGRPPGEVGPHGPGGGEGQAKPGADGPPPNSITAAEVPAGAPSRQVESVIVSETYVTKGAPTDAALKAAGQGFELKPLTHPNAVYVDQGFAFQLLVDGQPLANAPVSVYRAGNIYDDRRIAVETRTDRQGKGKVAFTQPGVYLLTTQSPAAAPFEAPPARSYTYSLTFEVTR